MKRNILKKHDIEKRCLKRENGFYKMTTNHLWLCKTQKDLYFLPAFSTLSHGNTVGDCMKRLIIGKEEWCSFPELGFPAIKFKTDTGATTSSLHALEIKTFFKDGKEYAHFITQLQRGRLSPKVPCVALISRRKVVTSSNGFREKRIVIKTILKLAERIWPVELTLANRSSMRYRMLLGREAMQNMLIKPRKSFFLGKYPPSSPST